jgi:1,4-alpha-glucan branching enzyme
MSWLTQDDFDRWQRAQHFDSYRKLGAHRHKDGVWFAVWAPHADRVSVLGDFNGWDPQAHPLTKVGDWAGMWEGFVHGAQPGHRYKYRLRRGRYTADKTDPYARLMEAPAEGGSSVSGLSAVVTDLSYTWGDHDWMQHRKGPATLGRPMSIYEVHLGSWMRKEDGLSPSYREIAEPLANHVTQLGFTHVELLPVMEHPYYPSWGYQVIGYYAATHRYGEPQDLMYLIDYLHQRGIGVILDWVPAHFAADPQGLVFFDGSTLFESDDPLMRYHPDWGTYVFDYAKPGVRNFLLSNACFWLDVYHIDGLRFDAVASMLYRDYSRQEWRPNRYGGREHLEAISLLKEVNEVVYSRFPEVLMIAEESTAWPKVSGPTYDGGLGFLYKWNMGWMHDTLEYMKQDPINRKFHHSKLTFPLWYAWSEHYILPLSHDEVVHMKGSLWGKMAGDPWQKAANLRLLYGHMVGSPGKKLLFMGSEYGQVREWSHDRGIDAHLIDQRLHAGVLAWMKDLFALYHTHEALWNDTPEGWQWLEVDNAAESILSYLRTSQDGKRQLVFVLNFTPVPRPQHVVGVPVAGTWVERFNSDAPQYGGSGVLNPTALTATNVPAFGCPWSLHLDLPPLGMAILEHEPPARPPAKSRKKSKTA